MGGTVLVKADFTWEADGDAQLTGACGSQLHAGGFDLGDGQVQLAFFFSVPLLGMALSGLLCGVAVAVLAMIVVPGFGFRRLAEVAGPGQAAKAECGDGGGQKG